MTGADRWLLRLALITVVAVASLHGVELLHSRAARATRIARAQQLAQQAEAHAARGDWALASAILTGAVEAWPESAALRTRLADLRVELVLARRGTYDAPESRALERAVQASAHPARRDVALAKLALHRGQRGLAQARLTAALEAEPELAEAHLYQGVLRFEAGELETAAAALTKALALAPGDAMARFVLGRVEMARRDWAAAARQLSKAAPALQTAQAWLTLGQVLHELDDLDGAEKAVRAAAALAPQDAAVQAQLGGLLVAAKRPADAIEPLLAATRGRPDPQAYALLGRALMDVGRHAEAVEVLTTLSGLRPNDPEVAYVLGVAAAKKGDRALARRALEGAVIRAGDDERWAGMVKDARVRLVPLSKPKATPTSAPTPR